MVKLFVKNEIRIKASAKKVWDALVNPDQTEKYMFGCRTVSDWKVGSPLLWRGKYEGNEMDFVSGFVLEIVPEHLLKYSVIDPNATYALTPENHLQVTYHVEAFGNESLLTVVQDGFETAEEGMKRYQEVYNNGEGWAPILVTIKAMLET